MLRSGNSVRSSSQSAYRNKKAETVARKAPAMAPKTPDLPSAMAELPVEEPEVPEELDDGTLVTVVCDLVAEVVLLVLDGVAPGGGDRTYSGVKILSRSDRARRETYAAQNMGNSVGHDNISLQHGDIVDEQLVIPLVDGNGDAQESLVLLAVLERSGIPNIPDDAVVLEGISQLVGGELTDIDSCGLECGVRGRETCEFGHGVDEFGEVGGLECVEQCREASGFGSLCAGPGEVEDPAKAVCQCRTSCASGSGTAHPEPFPCRIDNAHLSMTCRNPSSKATSGVVTFDGAPTPE